MASHRSSLLLLALLTFGLAAPAQMDMSGHVMSVKDQVPPEQLPEARELTGIGNVHMEITATPEAQMWFNQGLNLLFDFWDYESARAFEQGVRVDPQCAMCYWGLYKAETFFHSITQGYAARSLAAAEKLKDRVSPRERLYIEATTARPNANATALWRRLVKEAPGDVPARLFLSQTVARDESLAILESILKEDPENSAANHAYIHALEWTDHPEKALHSAEILARLAPASGHMVHMPGHIFFRIGDYVRAEQSFGTALQVDEAYMRDQHVSADDNWNYVHNLMYAIANLVEEGKWKDAAALSPKLPDARGQLPSTMYVYSTRDSITRLDPRLPVALRTADWARVLEFLKAAEPPKSRPNLGFLARALADFAAGMRAVEGKDFAKAEEASASLDAGLKQMRPAANAARATDPGPLKLEVEADALLQPLMSSLSIMSLELRASILAGQGKVSEAKTLFASAAQEEERLGYREPPAYIRPVAETEAAAWMAAGDWPGARAAWLRALKERPRSGFALYGLALTAEKSGDSAATAKGYADFLTAWDHADPELPQLAHAKAYLAR